MSTHFSLTSKALPAETLVLAFKGYEALSTPYSFEVYLLVPTQSEVELEDVIGDQVTFHLNDDVGHVVNGVIAACERLAESSAHDLFRATITPKLWYLSLARHSRIFTNESVKQVIEKVLKVNSFSSSDYELRLKSAYDPHEHICQYRESDLDFISRWMEREGIYYFFEQGDSAEKLIITDDKSSHEPKPSKPVRYYAQLGETLSVTTAGESLDTFLSKRTTLPTKVALKDYDYLKPKLDVSGSAKVSQSGQGEVHVYGEGFTTPDDGKRLAKIRAEELLAREEVYKGEGRVYQLAPGYTFTLDEHPRATFNTSYLTIARFAPFRRAPRRGRRLRHKLLDLERLDPYHVRVEAIPAKTQFRADRVTTWPRIYGTEEAVIDAEDGVVYAEIDPHGRYKVKIFFDESDLDDGKASMWVRMLQPHGGDIEGIHFPLRKGTEVHLVFLGGDPDRPVIAGVAHNAINPSAVTKSNNTRNVLQTGGKNRLEMEDQEGSQWVHMKTEPKGTFLFMGAVSGGSDGGKDFNVNEHPKDGEYNLNATTEGTGLVKTGHQLDILTENGNMTIKVEGGGTFLHDVTGTVTEEFHQTVTQTYGAHHEIKVEGGGRKEEITGDYEQEISAKYEQTIKGGNVQKITGGEGWVQEVVSPKWETTVNGPWELLATSVGWRTTAKIDFYAAGNIEFTGKDVNTTRTGNHKEFTLGTSQELSIGSFTDIKIGNVNEVQIAVVIDLKLAAAIEMTMGCYLEAKPAVDLGAKGAKLHKVGEKLESVAAHIQKASAAVLINAPVGIYKYGVMLWGP